MTDHGPPDADGGGSCIPSPYDPDYKTSVTRSPNLPLLSLESSPSEETGPRFGHSLIGRAR
jgi:protocatechuate 3,4-dioxygenase beta subunit